MFNKKFVNFGKGISAVTTAKTYAIEYTTKKEYFDGSNATIALILSLLVFVMLGGLSWITTCGVIKLVTMCFGWTFSWGVATGIWLIMCLARTVFRSNTTVKK